ncbi:MAG: mannitol dehydrogenase family protein [Burkholderiaceae bacterium]
MTRLAIDTLAMLPATVRRPAYTPAGVRVGIVHLGVGNFHRAHQAVAWDDLLGAGQAHWGVAGVSLRSDTLARALSPQQGLYTLLERGPQRVQARIVGSLRQCLHAPSQMADVLRLLADPQVQVVSLTVTENGYQRGANGDLNEQALAQAQAPADAPPSGTLAVLYAGLALRRQLGGPPLTLLSCDNLSGNGQVLMHQLRTFAERRGDQPTLSWLRDSVSAPDTMVDRIAPATTDADRADARALTGLVDAWPVATEPFTQWVIADRFAGQRPALAISPGVRLVADVTGYERMKLGLLNAAHSAIAYLGLAAGWTSVAEAIGHPPLQCWIERLWAEELVHALPASLHPEAATYTRELLVRFANPGLRHLTAQIANDGSQKTPLRWLPALQACRAAGRPTPLLSTAWAAWLHCLREPALAVQFTDPGVAALAAGWRGPADTAARALVAQPALFGSLAGDPALGEGIGRALARLEADGVVAGLAAH